MKSGNNDAKEHQHPGVFCAACKNELQPYSTRYMCTVCIDYDLCDKCETVHAEKHSAEFDTDQESHLLQPPPSAHIFAVIRDSRGFGIERYRAVCGKCPPYAPCICSLQYRCFDAYAMARTHSDIDDDRDALQ